MFKLKRTPALLPCTPVRHRTRVLPISPLRTIFATILLALVLLVLPLFSFTRVHNAGTSARVGLSTGAQAGVAVRAGTSTRVTNTLRSLLTPATATAAASDNLNFQARLTSANGAIVPDGYYNIEFKLYSASTGGAALWTETRAYNSGSGSCSGPVGTNDCRVRVVNGYVSVYLGSVTSFPSTIPWDQQLYLTMNVGGTTSTGSITYDGEMTPRLKLTAVPYAMRANAATQLQTSSGANLATLSIAAPTSGNQTFQIQDQGAAGTYNILTAPTGTDGYIKLQTATPGTQQTGNFNISGTGIADILQGTTKVVTATLDTGSAVALNLATTNATQINLNQSTVLAAGKSITVTGGNTASRPASPTEGMIYFDTTTKQLLVYANGKWQGDRSTATKIVAASNSSQAVKDAADYVADGTADEAEINAALTAAAGGKVYLAEGTYTIAASISVPNNTTLAGAGAGTVITIPNSFNTNINAVTNTTGGGSGTGIVIQDFQLDGNKANQTSGTMNGVYFSGVGSSSGNTAVPAGKIMNVSSSNWLNNGIWLNNFNNGTVTGSSARKNTTKGMVISGYYNTIAESIAQGNTDNGFDLTLNFSTFTGNLSQANSNSGIVATGSNNTYTGNTTDHNAQSGFWAGSGQRSTYAGNAVANNSVRGFFFSGVSDMVISGNAIADNGGSTGNSGIYFAGTSSNNTITGNTITDTSATTTNYAINLSVSTVSSTYLSDNTLGGGTINDAGTGTIYGGQSNGTAYLIQPTTNITIGSASTTTTIQGTLSITPQTSTSTTLLCTNSGVVSTCDASVLAPTATNFIQNQSSATQSGNFNIKGVSTTAPTAVIQQATGGTSDIFQVQNASGSNVLTVGSSGEVRLQPNGTSTVRVGANNSATATALAVGTTSTGWVGLSVRGVASQTADLLQLQDSSANVLAAFSATGDLSVQNVTVAANKSITVTGGNTASRPASPTEGMLYYDTDTHQLLVYNNSKWKADSSDAILVAASDSSAADKAAADYLADGNTAAAGDGDQIQINQALTAAAGKKVLLLAGTYTIDASVSVPNNTTLAGVGTGTVVTLPNSFNTNINAITNTTTGGSGTGIAIRDMKLDGNKTNQTSGNMYGVYINGAGSGSTVAGATVTNVTSNNWLNNGFMLNSGANSKFINNTALNNDYGFYANNNASSTLTGNISSGNATRGFSITSSSYVTVTGNVAQGSSGSGISISTSTYITVTSNVSQGNGYGVTLGSNTDHATVTGNSIVGNGVYGINVTTTSYNTITGNNIYNSGGSNTNNGIFLVSALNNTITGNNITDSTHTTNNYAINISDAASNANYFADNTLGGGTINDAGTGTIYSSQLDANGKLINKSVLGASVQATTDGAATFNVQNASGSNIFAVDTTNSQVVLGNSTTAGQITMSSGNAFSATITPATFTADRKFILPDTALATTASPATICVFNGSTSNCPAATGSSFYLWNSASVQNASNYYLRSATTTSAVGVLEGANGQTADLLSFNTYNGTTSTTVARITSAGNLQVAGSVDTATATALTIGAANATQINLNQSTVLAAGKSITVTGGNTASRPASPTEGMIYFDTTTKQLLAYSNGKWQGDRTTSTKIVAASNSSQTEKDAADYVATGTSDQTIINTALTAASGGKVYLMEGTYTVDGSISVPNNTTLAGAGMSTVITIPGGLNSNINAITNATVSGGTGVVIQDLKLDGANTSQASGVMNGIYIDGAGSGTGSTAVQGVKVANVWSNRWRGNGIVLNSSLHSSVINSMAKGNFGAGIDIESSSKNTIENNTVQGNDNGIYVNASSDIAITGNIAAENSYGIRTLSASNSTITGNVVRANTSYGVYFNSSTGTTFTGNNVQSGNQSGIFLWNSQRNTFTANTIQQNSGAGIEIQGSSAYNTVSANNFSDNGGTTVNNAFNIASTGYNTITSNTITDSSATTNNYAINLISGTANYLADNTLGGGIIVDGGTGTIYGGQLNDSGNYVIQPAGTIELQKNTNVTGTISGTSSLTLGTSSSTNGTIIFKNSTNANTVTLLSAAQTGNYTLTIPVLSANSTILTDTTGVQLQGSTPGTAQTGNFNISGTGIAGSLLTPTLDTASAIALNLGTTNATSINLNQDTILAAGKSIRITGGNTASRPASPTEGMLYYDTDTHQLLVYNNSKWKADGSDAILVAASDSSAADKAAADYLADGNTAAANDGDQVQINQALTAAAGKKVLLLAGTYTIDAEISIPNYTTLAGVGYATVITIPNNFNADINAITDSVGMGVSIQDIRLEGNRANQSSGTMNGIYLNNIGSGSGQSASTGARISNIWSNYWRSTGIYLNATVNSSITGSYFSTNQVAVRLNNSSSHIVISNNTLQGTIGTGILIQNSSEKNTITNNVLSGNWIGMSIQSDNNVVGNNTVDANGSTGMIFYASSGNTITGNSLKDSVGYGIYLQSTSNNNAVTSNAIGNSGDTTNNNAIVVEGSNNTISSNNITDTNCPTTCYAVSIFGSSNYLADNTLGGGTINNAGSGTIYGGQYNGTAYLIQPTTNITIGSASTTTTIQGTLSITPQTSTSTTLLCTNAGVVSTCDASVLAPTTSNFIQNQATTPGTAQTGNFNITGNGIADILQGTTKVLTTTLDTTGATALNIGTATATGVNIATNAAAHTVNIATDAATNQTVNIGSKSGTSSTTISAGSGSLLIDLQQGMAINSGGAQKLGINTNTTSLSNSIININDSTGAAFLSTDEGTGNVTVAWNRTLVVNGGANFVNGFSIQSGGSSQTYTTPLGVSIQTKANLSNQTLGSFNTLLAGGISSGSDASARGILIADARIVAHQPTIGILSADENQIAGLSFDATGTTTTPAATLFIKSTDNTIALQGNGVNLLTAQKNGTDAITTFGVAGTNSGKLVLTTNANSNAVTLQSATQTGNYTLTIPALTANSTILTDLTGIQLQSTTPGTAQTGNFNITGTGIADILQGTTKVLTATLDTTGATALNIGGSTPTTTQINLNQSTVVATGKTIRLMGNATANRPSAAGNEGMLYYDTTTHQLLQSNGTKWVADKVEAVIVAASNSSQADKDAADYTLDGNTAAANDGDQVELNTILAAAAGKKVILLAGTYVADATILIPDNTTLAGVGSGTVIEMADIDATDNLIENDPVATTGIVIRDLKLDGRSDLNTAGTQNGIAFTNVGTVNTALTGSIITNVQVYRFRTFGISFSNSFGNTVSVSTISNNGTDTVTATGGIFIATNSAHNIVTNNVFSNDISGVYLSGVSTNTIANNKFVNSGGASTNNGIYVNSANTNNFTGNTFTDSAATQNYAINITNSASTTNYIADNTLGSGSSINDAGTGTAFAGQLAATSGPYKIQNANGVTVSTSITAAASTNSTNVNINTGNATGSTSNSGSISIDVGTATGTTGTVSIGTTNASAVSISNTTAATTTAIYGGTGASAITLQAGASGVITMGSQIAANTINIGTVGSAAFSSTVNIATSTGAAQTVSIGSATGTGTTTVKAGTGGLSLGDGGIANTIQIGNTTGAVAQTVNVGNNATASSSTTVNVGSTIGTSTTAIQSGSGGLSLNSNGGTVSLGTASGLTGISIGRDSITTTLAGALQLSGTETAASYKLAMNGGVSNSALVLYGFQNQMNFNPLTSAGTQTAVYALNNMATLASNANSANLVVTQFMGTNTSINTAAGFTGTITNGYGLNVGAPTLAGGKIDNYYGIGVADVSANGGNTSGIRNNNQIYVNSNTAAAGAGGTMYNSGVKVNLPAGSSAGTTNYGLFLTGNGGVAAAANWAIYNDSTAANYIQGNVSIGTSTNTNNYALNINGTGYASTSFITPLVQSQDGAVVNNLTIRSGNNSAGTAGTVSIDTGTSTAGSGTINVGTATAGTVNIGKATGLVNIISRTITVGAAGGTTTIQASSQTGNNNGDQLTIKAGAGSGSGNGGTLLISGGDAGTTGVTGLVNLNPTAFTGTSQNCTVVSCSITAASVNTNSTILVNNTYAGSTVALSDPTIQTAGRILYVTNSGTQDMTLSVNGGGAGNTIALKMNTTATMFWNGVDWTAAGASSATDLQAAYNNTQTTSGGAEIVLNSANQGAGLTIRNDSTPITGALFEVQSSIAASLFSVNNNTVEYAVNGGAENSTLTGWSNITATASKNATLANVATGLASVQVATSGSNQGAKNTLSATLTANTTYVVSFAVKASSAGPFNFNTYFSIDGTANSVNCNNTLAGTGYTLTNNFAVTNTWTKVSCFITTPASGITAANAIRIYETDMGTATFYIDNLSVISNDANTTPANVQIGGGATGGQPTLFTLDQFAGPPMGSNKTAYYGSMYYDTTMGAIQCYQSTGWGACGNAPDDIVTLTPEYSNAVLNGTGVGTMTADFCGNDGSGLTVNTSLCSTVGEARNYYKWTSPQPSPQTYSVYVTYKLPASFKKFVSGSTSLTGLVDNTSNAGVSYSIYRKAANGTSLTSCSASKTVVGSGTGSINTWTTAPPTTDPSGCTSFVAGDSMIIKITVTAQSNATAYIENLSFQYSNK